MTDFLTTVALPAVVALVGGAGFWAFLSSTRSATSAEYKQFVEDLQQERRDRESALIALRQELDDEREERAEQALLIGDLIHHIERLEERLQSNGVAVPNKPTRVREYIKLVTRPTPQG